MAVCGSIDRNERTKPMADLQPLSALLAMLDASHDPHIVCDPQYRIVGANAAYRRHFGGAEGVAGRTCFQVSHHYTVPCDQAGEACPLARCRESGVPERILHVHHTPRGEEHVDIEVTPIRDGEGALRYFVERMRPLPAPVQPHGDRSIIGRSPAIRQALELVSRVAPSVAAVLLEGESGTGKELLAQAVHAASPRASGPFITVDCSGIPETLFESEVFGHERGAFTGATAARAGLVEAASGGTLFLDEVGEIPLTMQVKLLRLIETASYRRLGATEWRRADIRIVSATNRDLRSEVARGAFRADLFYRVSAFPIRLPALRERPGDIPDLARALLARVASGRRLDITPKAMACLTAHPFPGNVRELRNALERASLLCDGLAIEPRHLPAEITRPAAGRLGTDALSQALANEPGLTRRELARRLGVSERTLYRRLREEGGETPPA